MAPTPSGWYEVADCQRGVYVRARGLASMNNCLCLRDFIEGMLRDGRRFVIVDLRDCTGMDSTFMGVLAGAATFEKDGQQAGVAVVNSPPGLIRLLRSVGLGELILIEEKPFDPPQQGLVRLDDKPSEEERLAMIHSAHTRLIQISAENEKVFGPLVALLESEMRQRGFHLSD